MCTRVIIKVYSTNRVEIKFVYTIRTGMCKQNFKKTDVKGRRYRYRIGLETLVDYTENYECHRNINKCVNILPYE